MEEECEECKQHNTELKHIRRAVWIKDREMEEIYTAKWRMRKEVLKKPAKNKDKKRNMKARRREISEEIEIGFLELTNKALKDNCIC